MSPRVDTHTRGYQEIREGQGSCKCFTCYQLAAGSTGKLPSGARKTAEYRPKDSRMKSSVSGEPHKNCFDFRGEVGYNALVSREWFSTQGCEVSDGASCSLQDSPGC